MRYLTKSFWGMTIGFALIISVALSLLYLSQFYEENSRQEILPTENYLAG